MTDQQPETPEEPTPEEQAAIQTDPPAATPTEGEPAPQPGGEPAPIEEELAPGEPTGSDGSPVDSRGLSEEQQPNPAAPDAEDDEDDEDDDIFDSTDEPDVDTTVSGATAPGGAVMANADGVPVQHGEPNPGLGVTPGEEEPREPLPEQGEFEPEAIEIDRPDIGTPVEVTEVEVIEVEVEPEPEPPTV
jgi:hypothetical protein